MTQAKLKNPDLTRYGFYLYPKVYKDSMGYDRAHGLLFLDSRGSVEKSLAKTLGMVRLLNSANSVLYAINPTDGKYPNASDLLKSLSLGSVANQRLISKEDLRREFLDQCQQCGIVLSLLDKSVRIGVNKDGNIVYESKSGRYIVDEADKGKSKRDVPNQELLYAVNDEGILIDSQVEYCLESLFKFHLNVEKDKLHYINNNDFNNFVHTVTKTPPPKLPDMGNYRPISFYGDVAEQSIGNKTSEIIDVFERLEAKIMMDFDFDKEEEFERFYHHSYNRALPATNNGYKTNLPAPLVVILLKLMKFNLVKTPHIYAHSIGNLAMLSGLMKLHQSGSKVTACDRYKDKQEYFNSFLSDFYDIDADDPLIVNPPMPAVEPYDGSICYLPAGNEPTAVLIPHSNTQSYKKSVAQMLDVLERRKSYGRSIFIAPTDAQGRLGELDDDSLLMIKYLYQNYQNVLIFDCHHMLSLPTRNSCEYRIFVIGERVDGYSALNLEEVEELLETGSIRSINSPHDFYLLCTDYGIGVDNVEISSVDLMENLMGLFDDDDATTIAPPVDDSQEDHQSDEEANHESTKVDVESQAEKQDDEKVEQAESEAVEENGATEETNEKADTPATPAKVEPSAATGADDTGTGEADASALASASVADTEVQAADSADTKADADADVDANADTDKTDETDKTDDTDKTDKDGDDKADSDKEKKETEASGGGKTDTVKVEAVIQATKKAEATPDAPALTPNSGQSSQDNSAKAQALKQKKDEDDDADNAYRLAEAARLLEEAQLATKDAPLDDGEGYEEYGEGYESQDEEEDVPKEPVVGDEPVNHAELGRDESDFDNEDDVQKKINATNTAFRR